MSAGRPAFELRRVFDDGEAEEPQVVSLRELGGEVRMGRRGFLGTGVVASAVLGKLSGCTLPEKPPFEPRVEPEPLDVPEAPEPPPAPTVTEVSDGDFPALEVERLEPVRSPEGTLRAHDVRNGRRPVTCLAFDADGGRLATGFTDDRVKVWDVATLARTASFTGPDDPVHARWANADELLLAGGDGLYLWSPGAGLVTGVLARGAVESLAQGAGRRLLASAGPSAAWFDLWETETPSHVARAASPTGPVEHLALAVHANEPRLAGATGVGGLTLWDLDEVRPRAAWRLPGESFGALEVCHGDRYLATGAGDVVRFWDASSGAPQLALRLEEAGSIEHLAGHPAHPTRSGLAFAAGERLWFLSFAEGTLRELVGHTGDVRALALDSTGSLLASGDAEGVVILWDLAAGECRGYLFDPKTASPDTEANSFNVRDKVTGQWITYTLPCGAPIPAGAVCTCNCVPGTYVPPRRRSSSSGYRTRTVCTCDTICTCVPICQAHRLTHSDGRVRAMAEHVLFVMGLAERAYLDWARAGSDERGRRAIDRVVADLEAGAPPRRPRPTPRILEPLLAHEDSVVRVMAAQLLSVTGAVHRGTAARVGELLELANRLSWVNRR